MVIIREELCIGCWTCTAFCPYGVINPSPERKIAVKCDRCLYMEKPVCVDVCPTKALEVVELEEIEELLREKRRKTAKRWRKRRGRDSPSRCKTYYEEVLILRKNTRYTGASAIHRQAISENQGVEKSYGNDSFQDSRPGEPGPAPRGVPEGDRPQLGTV